MLILKAEAPAGLTILQAIEDALNLSRATNSMIAIEINDIPMTITDSPIFGADTKARIDTFLREYQFLLKEKHSTEK